MSRVELTAHAEKDLERLRGMRRKALQAIFQLEQNPEKGHLLTGTLKGVRSLEFSLPGGAYRAAYVLSGEKDVCLIFIVGPHENFYEKAERRHEALKKLNMS
jgi:mRNA interferase RelE/StbE